MANIDNIEFNKERDFSETLGAAFTFVRQNFKVLICMITILIPKNILGMRMYFFYI